MNASALSKASKLPREAGDDDDGNKEKEDEGDISDDGGGVPTARCSSPTLD